MRAHVGHLSRLIRRTQRLLLRRSSGKLQFVKHRQLRRLWFSRRHLRQKHPGQPITPTAMRQTLRELPRCTQAHRGTGLVWTATRMASPVTREFLVCL